jgi:hypothetical protein
MPRRRFLDRTHRRREQSAEKGQGFNPAGMIRLAGFGAALVIGLAVYVGFHRQDETIYDGRWGVLERLIQPLFFGFTALDLIVLCLVGLVAWRIWQRMGRRR